MFQKRKNETGVQRNGLFPTRDKCCLTFRQEFEARFIGRDIKVLATGVCILDSLFQNTIYILIYSTLRRNFQRSIVFSLTNFHLKSIVIS